MMASVSVMAETGVAAAAPDGVTATVYPGMPGQFLEPTEMAVDEATNMVYAVDERTLTVLDGNTNTITATVGGVGYARTVAVDEATDTLYVADYVGGRATVIDGATNTVVTTIPVGSDPGAIVVDANTHRIYVAVSGGLAVIDGATNTVVAKFTTLLSLATFNPTTDTLYFVNGPQNVITAVDGSTLTVTGTVQIARNDYYSYGLVVDPTTDTLYAVGFYNEYTNGITVIDGADLAVTAVPGRPRCVHSRNHRPVPAHPLPHLRSAGDPPGRGSPMSTPSPTPSRVAAHNPRPQPHRGGRQRYNPCSLRRDDRSDPARRRCPPGAQPPRYHHRVGR